MVHDSQFTVHDSQRETRVREGGWKGRREGGKERDREREREGGKDR